MPFRKRGKSYWHRGRKYSARQVRLYHAHNGFPKKKRKKK